MNKIDYWFWRTFGAILAKPTWIMKEIEDYEREKRNSTRLRRRFSVRKTKFRQGE